jgi:hypothetical protein
MRPLFRATLLFPSLAVLVLAQSTYAGSDRVITFPGFDADAKQVELFAGMEDGTFATKVIPLGPQGGNLLVSNTTTEPLTVKMPQSFVAVQVLKQLPPGPPGGNNNAQPGGGGGGGQQQAVGGGPQGNNQPNQNQNPFGGPGNGNGPGNGAGNGFFSIPPERTIKVSYVSVCLEHGKADPTPLANYKLVKTEDYTKDRTFQAVIAMVASGRLEQQSAQAAVWHCSDDMSWKQLEQKYSHTVLGKVAYFTAKELLVAQAIVDTATKQVAASDVPVTADRNL